MTSIPHQAAQYYRQLVDRHRFLPGWPGVLVNPFFIARRGLAAGLRRFANRIQGGELLDVGCGTQPYRSLFTVDQYTGLEYDTPQARQNSHADVFYGGDDFPFSDQRFDVVLCNQVLEHVFNPGSFLQEIRRVLKPGGKLLLTVPFVWDEHEQPNDYARYSSFGLAHLLETNGFDVLEQHKTNPDLSTVCQMTNAYLYKISQNWPAVLREAFSITAMALVTIIGMIAKLLPDNPDLFLDQVVLAKAREIANHG